MSLGEFFGAAICDRVAIKSLGENVINKAITEFGKQLLHRASGQLLYRLVLSGFFVGLIFASAAFAQESPYIITYDHYLEEPGNLEVEYFSTFGTQRGGNDFHSYWLEFEYGATAYWTTELYLDGQTTFHDSSIFTGFRFENRFRPFKFEHFVNPVLYVEYEQVSAADKLLKEVEG